ncbi:heparan-alpha-glucosaminide N-acetyltransferase domain-containing protein [Gelidibacter salicanalis]|uniref:heparan-alpha-glucosaminide N-acetyltransferase domain-containing protein n=1 Tax=Gelidibacter salicanalis TaxID=291193 RepID=UPI001F15D7A2|nr:heparan-alpha-glucosaminide N-acetyltransferase domain-containing protein [Gelidibacter salicanalis]
MHLLAKTSLKANRLYFIDAVRAFAILMMLQGHFVDTLLNPIYRDDSYTAYTVWSYFRGITAPTFFTISGLVFLYLLLKAHAKGSDKQRLRKGATRGLMLIGIGYALRIPFFSWLKGDFDSYFLVIDVLQCIGLSLLLLIGFYLLCRRNSTILSVVLLSIGCVIFVTEPLYRSSTLENVPVVLANYLSKSNGSVFTILPWFGYVAFGGFFATLFFKYSHKQYFRQITLSAFFALSFILLFYSTQILQQLFVFTNVELFERAANYNYLFLRLGNVMLYFGFFYLLERFMKQSIVTRIGETTLNIYVVHFIIIYGSFTGIGLKHFYYKSLEPWEAVFGALTFIVVVCIIVFHIGKTNAFIYKYLRKLLHLIKPSETTVKENNEEL